MTAHKHSHNSAEEECFTVDLLLVRHYSLWAQATFWMVVGNCPVYHPSTPLLTPSIPPPPHTHTHIMITFQLSWKCQNLLYHRLTGGSGEQTPDRQTRTKIFFKWKNEVKQLEILFSTPILEESSSLSFDSVPQLTVSQSKNFILDHSSL